MSDTDMSVQQAITEVMRRLPAIGKDERAPGSMGGYAYRGIEQMTRVIQPIMAEVGLVIVPSARLVSLLPSPGQKEAWQDAVLEVDWTIVGPDGSTLQARTVGIGRDHTDKQSTKAQTQAFKYLLMELFCVSDADDDADGHDYSNAERDEPVERPGHLQVMDRVVAAAKADPDIGVALKALASNMGYGLTPRMLETHTDLVDAIVEALDGFEAAAAQEAHSGPQAPN